MSNVLRISDDHSAGLHIFAQALQMLRNSHAIFGRWRARERRRAELRRLLRVGPHLIADVGLDPAAALAESRKLPWQA